MLKDDLIIEGSLWGFKRNDIITDTQRILGPWYRQRVRVLRFGKNNSLWGIAIGTGQKEQLVLDPNGLILLERPGLRFKLGDNVEVLRTQPGKLFVGMYGEVIAISPDEGRFPFLVRFRQWDGGVYSREWWDRPWFPKDNAVLTEDHIWVGNEEDWLELKKE